MMSKTYTESAISSVVHKFLADFIRISVILTVIVHTLSFYFSRLAKFVCVFVLYIKGVTSVEARKPVSPQKIG